MSRTVLSLIEAAKESAIWMQEATAPNEINPALRKLQKAIERTEKERDSKKTSGTLVLVELGDGRRRITATVASGEEYLSRSGIAALGVQAQVVYSVEVRDLDEARRQLKETLEAEEWAGHGMTWCELSRDELITAISIVAESVNGPSLNAA